MMFHAQVAFSGYAIIGLTLLLLAMSVAFFLLRQSSKSAATWSLIAFFVMVALSGGATILANSLIHWSDLFVPWQDFWILASGIALANFAYSFPYEGQLREARSVQIGIGSLALVALLYTLVFDYRFIFSWSPKLAISDLYYLLLPTGILLIVLVFLRRSAQFSAQAERSGGQAKSRHIGQRLLYPYGNDAKALRNLALALSLAFLPALQTLLRLPSPYGFILSNIGSILAIIAIALVYFNYSPEVNSFMAKLVGITLACVLLALASFGSVDVYGASEVYYREQMQIAELVREVLTNAGKIESTPAPVSYVVAWSASDPVDAESYRELYRAANERHFDLSMLIDENRKQRPQLPDQNSTSWKPISRSWPLPVDRLVASYGSYQFVDRDVAYEIGFSTETTMHFTSAIVVKWLMAILICSALILLIFPLLFRRTLVRPLGNLLQGIMAMNRGNLDVVVPVRFYDEIGSLTESFNKMARSLRLSQRQQEELFNRLQASYDELEEKVSDRTRELSAFTDLTMLPGEYEEIADILQPALNRIMEVGLCEVLCVHLLTDDETGMMLVAQRNMPENAVETLEYVALSATFAERIKRVDDPMLTRLPDAYSAMPVQLGMEQYQTYLGSPLAAGNQSHGWLSCYRRAGQSFSVGEISLLVALARQMGVIVENHHLRQRIKEIAAGEERQRLARDLHDSVTQLVYSMTLFTRSAQEAAEDGDIERLSTNLSRIASTSVQALREMRFLLFELQPPALESAGLVKALDARFDMVERRVGIRVESMVDEHVLGSKNIERELYYVVIEALNNSLKHAYADRVELILDGNNGDVRLSLADNGCGFDTVQTSAGLGISNMRQRISSLGGVLQIDSAIGQGTRVIATVPAVQ